MDEIEARNLEFHLGLSNGYQEPKDLNHQLLPPSVHISGTLELEVQLELKLDMGCGCLIM